VLDRSGRCHLERFDVSLCPLVRQFGLDVCYGMLMAAEGAKRPGERAAGPSDEWRRQQADRAAMQAHCEAREAWERKTATTAGCGFCRWCRSDVPTNCDYR
jgi:hypothetical protein